MGHLVRSTNERSASKKQNILFSHEAFGGTDFGPSGSHAASRERRRMQMTLAEQTGFSTGRSNVQ